MKLIQSIADIITGKKQRQLEAMERWARNEYKKDQPYAVNRIRQFGGEWIKDRTLGN